MNNIELCNNARNAGLSKYGKIKYRTGDDWRYNVGLWCGNYWSFDCLGFVHALVNGFIGDTNKLGGGAVMDEFVLSTTEYRTLYDYCYDISYDFTNITAGELLYMNGHVGLYIGDCEPFNDGRVFNVAECCYSSFGGGGILTYVTQAGTRLNHKNGKSAYSWSQHGKFYRVDYTGDIVVPSTKVTPAEILDVVNDTFIGTYGNNPERENVLTETYGADVYRKVQDIINILYK